MDQTVFLNELLAVKNRVAEIASTFNRSSRPQLPLHHDVFSDHLEDVKARLHTMQTSLELLSAGQTQSMGSSQRTPSAKHMIHPTVFPHMPSLRSALPSGPLFWQLFNSLRVDVRGLNERVSAVEQEVSDLEDRLDGMRVDRFTPEASEEMYSAAPTHREYFDLEQPDEASAHFYQHHTHPQATSYPQRQHGASDLYSAAPILVEQGAVGCPAPEGVAFRDREIVALEDRVRDLQESLRCSEDLVAERNDTIGDLYQKLRGCNNVIAHHDKNQHKYQTMINDHDTAMQTMASTMARNHDFGMRAMTSQFRERYQELEHNARQLQRSLEESDEVQAEKDEALQMLRDTAARNSSIIMKQQEIISRGAAIIKERDDEIERLTQDLNLSKTQEVDREVDREEQVEREECAKLLIERLTREISKLQASRKAGEAFERSEACAKLEESYNRERQERKHCAKLLAERTEETVELRKALTKALTPHLPYGGRADQAQGSDQAQVRDRSTLSPFATPLGRRASSMQWIPQALPQSSKLPHEVRRASIWSPGNAVAGESLKFGEPAQVNSPMGHQGSRRGLRMDEPAEYRGLPARKSSSMADMRSRNGDRVHQRETGARHHPGHDTVSKSRLQAYVEAEESSDGEQRGDAA